MKNVFIAFLSVFLFPVFVFALANPASEKCIADGGTLEMQADLSGGQYGNCVFPNGKVCEEWAYYRGECTTKRDLFYDVPALHPFAEDINYLYQKGIVQGYGNKMYHPESTINRVEFTKIIIESLYPQSQIDECDISKYSFPDLQKDHWYNPYVCVAKKEGIINGYADGTFQPENQITLPEAMKVILEGYNINLSSYETIGVAHSTRLYPVAYGEWYGKYMNYFGMHLNLVDKFPEFLGEDIVQGNTEIKDSALVHKISRGEMAYFIKTMSEKKITYIGLTELDAMNLAGINGVPFRVVERDGNPLPATMDYHIGRINATIENGVVVSFVIEGELNSIYKKLFISSHHPICFGVGQMECMMVQWGTKTKDWVYFYNTIKGFTPEKGIEYEIVVREKTLVDVPADASTKEYTFLSMISKTISYIGLTESGAMNLAEKNGVPFRVVERDGKILPTTKDYRIGRINAIVENGVVVSYRVEGQEETAQKEVVIPKTCTSWYDGCNTCTVENGVLWGCTKKYCIRSESPYCIQ